MVNSWIELVTMLNNLALFFVFSDSQLDVNFKPFVKDLYQCTLARLKAADIDQEVKERAISCM